MGELCFLHAVCCREEPAARKRIIAVRCKAAEVIQRRNSNSAHRCILVLTHSLSICCAAVDLSHDMGRDAFVEEIWQWKEKTGSRIYEQVGASYDVLDMYLLAWVPPVYLTV